MVKSVCETAPKFLCCVGFEYAFFLRSSFTLCYFRVRYRWYAFINVDETVQKGLNFVFFLFLLLLLVMNFSADEFRRRSWCGHLPCIWQKQLHHRRKHWSYRYGSYVNRDLESRGFSVVPANRKRQEVTWLVPCRRLRCLRFTFVRQDNTVGVSEVSQGLMWPITSQAHVCQT